MAEVPLGFSDAVLLAQVCCDADGGGGECTCAMYKQQAGECRRAGGREDGVQSRGRGEGVTERCRQEPKEKEGGSTAGKDNTK